MTNIQLYISKFPINSSFDECIQNKLPSSYAELFNIYELLIKRDIGLLKYITFPTEAKLLSKMISSKWIIDYLLLSSISKESSYLYYEKQAPK